MSGSDNWTVRLWDAETGALRQTFVNDRDIAKLSFSYNGSCLATDRSFYLGPLHLHSIPTTTWPLFSLDKGRSWIKWKGHNILWLPPEYRPYCQVVQDNILAMGHKSGRITIIRFELDEMEYVPAGLDASKQVSESSLEPDR